MLIEPLVGRDLQKPAWRFTFFEVLSATDDEVRSAMSSRKASRKQRIAGTVPVIDLFAGPGGLGEGFSAVTRNGNRPVFRICLSVEKDGFAHKTLELRSFFRQFRRRSVPEAYYEHLRGNLTLEELFARHPLEAARAAFGAWNAELGVVPEREVDQRIRDALAGAKSWVLIGGPPCQAYSIVGRARRKGIIPESDRNLHLYREYIRIVAEHQPPVFVMENVKGILSSRVNGALIFQQILNDLRDPVAARLRLNGGGRAPQRRPQYRLHSFVRGPQERLLTGEPSLSPRDFIVECEKHGIPQCRHRVIVLGIRDDLSGVEPGILSTAGEVTAKSVLADLPRLRSGLSREQDSGDAWKSRLRDVLGSAWMGDMLTGGDPAVHSRILNTLLGLRVPKRGLGKSFIASRTIIDYQPDWYHDPRLGGVTNHVARLHMHEDLHRYLFASSYGTVHGASPKMADFPAGLLPEHRNVRRAISDSHFADRFRVQVRHRPSTTITSHAAKDGHYYIHPDPTQCRSMTVREHVRAQRSPEDAFSSRLESGQYMSCALSPTMVG